MVEDCTFCQIIEGQIPSKQVLNNDEFVVFWDREPKAPVHVLVVPKRHIANLDAATEDDKEFLGNILLTCQKVAKDLGTEGKYKVVTNIGEFAGQTVFHMHYHLLGGWENKEDVVSELKQG